MLSGPKLVLSLPEGSLSWCKKDSRSAGVNAAAIRQVAEVVATSAEHLCLRRQLDVNLQADYGRYDIV